MAIRRIEVVTTLHRLDYAQQRLIGIAVHEAYFVSMPFPLLLRDALGPAVTWGVHKLELGALQHFGGLVSCRTRRV